MAKKENYESRIAAFIKDGAEHAALVHEEDCCRVLDQCESPIEKLLLAALYNGQDGREFFAVEFMGKSNSPFRFLKDETLYIYQQSQVGRYRVDFLIHDCSFPLEIRDPRWMIVECDGHEFHEKTKEQARHDKQRDRYFQSLGFKVLHFTGSEIWADPEKCAEEVFAHAATNDDWRNRDDLNG